MSENPFLNEIGSVHVTLRNVDRKMAYDATPKQPPRGTEPPGQAVPTVSESVRPLPLPEPSVASGELTFWLDLFIHRNRCVLVQGGRELEVARVCRHHVPPKTHLAFRIARTRSLPAGAVS